MKLPIDKSIVISPVEIEDVGKRIVTKQMMHNATGSKFIGATPTAVLMRCQNELARGHRSDPQFCVFIRELLERECHGPHRLTEKVIDKYVKLGACAFQFMYDLGYEPPPIGKLSREMCFEVFRGCIVRGVDHRFSGDLRGALGCIDRALGGQNLTRDLEVDLQAAFGFSPCNKSPVQLHKKVWWLGDPLSIPKHLKLVPQGRSLAATLLLSNAFSLSLRAAAGAVIRDGAIEINGQNSRGEFVTKVLPIEKPFQQWAVGILAGWARQGAGEWTMFPTPALASKYVLNLENKMEVAGILPADTDYVCVAMQSEVLQKLFK